MASSFRDTRSWWKRLQAWQIVLVVLGAGLAAGFLTTVLAGGRTTAGPHWTFLIALVIGLAGSVFYWRRLDEAAKEAQKAAWMWGGGVALALLTAVAQFVHALQPDLASLLNAPSLTPASWLSVGVGVALTTQLIGFLVAWAIWWLRKR